MAALGRLRSGLAHSPGMDQHSPLLRCGMVLRALLNQCCTRFLCREDRRSGHLTVCSDDPSKFPRGPMRRSGAVKEARNVLCEVAVSPRSSQLCAAGSRRTRCIVHFQRWRQRSIPC